MLLMLVHWGEPLLFMCYYPVILPRKLLFYQEFVLTNPVCIPVLLLLPNFFASEFPRGSRLEMDFLGPSLQSSKCESLFLYVSILFVPSPRATRVKDPVGLFPKDLLACYSFDHQGSLFLPGLSSPQLSMIPTPEKGPGFPETLHLFDTCAQRLGPFYKDFFFGKALFSPCKTGLPFLGNLLSPMCYFSNNDLSEISPCKAVLSS